jgi:hypothetical protein
MNRCICCGMDDSTVNNESLCSDCADNVQYYKDKISQYSEVLRNIIKEPCSECSDYKLEESCNRYRCVFFKARELLLEEGDD